jgi:hypothetical protein
MRNVRLFTTCLFFDDEVFIEVNILFKNLVRLNFFLYKLRNYSHFNNKSQLILMFLLSLIFAKPVH